MVYRFNKIKSANFVTLLDILSYKYVKTTKMKSRDSFERRHRMIKTMFWVIFGIAGLIIIAGIIAVIFGITNPEAIGEFFGKIKEGFDSIN